MNEIKRKENSSEERELFLKSKHEENNNIDLERKNPKKIGKCRCFIFRNNNPLLVIGPDCKFINSYFEKHRCRICCNMLIHLNDYYYF